MRIEGETLSQAQTHRKRVYGGGGLKKQSLMNKKAKGIWKEGNPWFL